jgi:stage V sporulation protein S
MSDKSNKLKVKADPPGTLPEERKRLVRRLAGAVAHALRNHGETSIRCVGNPCIGKGCKALAISKEFIASHNLALYCAPAFIEVDMDGEKKTGISFCAFTDDVAPIISSSGKEVELWVNGDGGCDPEARKKGVKKLAGAIAHNLRDIGTVKVRCFGNASIGKAAKSLAVARGFVAVHGLDLYCSPYFITEVIGGEEKTGIGFHVFAGGNDAE